MWVPCDVSMTSAPVVWAQNVRVTDMWARSTVNTAGSQTGFGLGRSGPGRAEHVACCDAATSRPWALIGLHPQHGSHCVAHGGPALMVHGLTAGRMVDQVHRLFSLARLTCTELTHGWPARGCSPVFFRGGAPVDDECPVSLRGSAGVRLGRGKASPGHDSHDPEV